MALFGFFLNAVNTRSDHPIAVTVPIRLLKNVFEAASARQNPAKRGSLWAINDQVEPVFNAAIATQIVFQQPAIACFTKLSLYLFTAGGTQRPSNACGLGA
jgi:hypothetical protein